MTEDEKKFEEWLNRDFAISPLEPKLSKEIIPRMRCVSHSLHPLGQGEWVIQPLTFNKGEEDEKDIDGIDGCDNVDGNCAGDCSSCGERGQGRYEHRNNHQT